MKTQYKQTEVTLDGIIYLVDYELSYGDLILQSVIGEDDREVTDQKLYAKIFPLVETELAEQIEEARQLAHEDKKYEAAEQRWEGNQGK